MQKKRPKIEVSKRLHLLGIDIFLQSMSPSTTPPPKKKKQVPRVGFKNTANMILNNSELSNPKNPIKCCLRRISN